MIEYFDAGTTEFVGGTLLPMAYEAEITHEKNGRFDLEFKYPLEDGKYKDFTKHTIFYTNVPYMDKQAFYLSDIEKRLDYVLVYCKHIGFLLDKNVTKDLHSLTNGDTGHLMLDKFDKSLQLDSNFRFSSDITSRHVFNKPSYDNALGVLASGKHSILGQWGGTLVMDNWHIRLLERWGRDTEFLIAKRKNINDIEINAVNEDIVTRLFLTTTIQVEEENESGEIVEVDKEIEAIVDSPIIDEYPQVYGRAMETEDESVESVEDLIHYGNEMYRTQRIDLPKESFTLDVTDDVKDYEFTVDDTALVYYKDYDIYDRVMVHSYRYNPVEKKYIEINFGEKEKTMSQTISQGITDNIGDYVDIPDIDMSDIDLSGIQGAIDEITKNLGNPEGGVVKFRKNDNGDIIEILIVDNADLDRAKNIWRLNIQGISHSSNGINGNFDVAMTQEGEIVADFMTTGTLNASLIKAGVLSSFDNSSWIDMANGNFNFKDSFKWDNDKKKIIFDENVDMKWENISNPPNIPPAYSDTRAVTAWKNSGYATNITNTGLYTGKVRANQLLIGGGNGLISFDQLENLPFIPRNAGDIGARPDDWTPSASEVGARPSNWTPTAAQVGARPSNWTPTAAQVGARPRNWVPTWSQIKNRPNIITANDIRTTIITKDWIGTLGLMVGNEIQMGSNARISWSNVTGTTNVASKSDIPTDSHITRITRNNVTSEFINGMTITGATIRTGANSNYEGNIILNEEGIISYGGYGGYYDNDKNGFSLTRGGKLQLFNRGEGSGSISLKDGALRISSINLHLNGADIKIHGRERTRFQGRVEFDDAEINGMKIVMRSGRGNEWW